MTAFAGWSTVVVRGPSMAPALRDGDVLVVRRLAGAAVRPGDVVVAEHPARPGLLLVKRAVRRVAGGWWLLSDNEFVTSDSREFGAVSDTAIRARAVLRLRDPVRVARISRLRRPGDAEGTVPNGTVP